MTTVIDIPLNIWELKKYNQAHGTKFNQHHINRTLAARRIGFQYDIEDDLYVCPKCEQTFYSISDMKNWHDCDADEDLIGTVAEMMAFYKEQAQAQKKAEVKHEETDHMDKVDEMMAFFTTKEATTNETPKTQPVELVSLGEPVVQQVKEQPNEPEGAAAQPVEAVRTPIFFGLDPVYVDGAYTLPKPKKVTPKAFETHINKCLATLAIEEYDASIEKLDVEVHNICANRKSYISETKEEEPVLVQYTPHIISSISIGGGVTPSSADYVDYPAKKVHATSISQRHKKGYVRKIVKSHVWIENFISEITLLMRKTHKGIEIADKGRSHTVVGKYTKYKGRTFFKVTTKHEVGKLARKDYNLTPSRTITIKKLCHYTDWYKRVNGQEFGKGSSGLVINPRYTDGKIGIHNNSIFIIRGRWKGKLINSCVNTTFRTIKDMAQYSSKGDKFFKSFADTFVYNRPKHLSHTCESDFSVEDCGTIAALITQTIFQFGKITCKKCADDFCGQTHTEHMEALNAEVGDTIRNIKEKFPHFEHVGKFLEMYSRMVNLKNTNLEAFNDTTQLVGNLKESPFRHITIVNNVLIKGGQATSDELAHATDALREIARYNKNRTDIIASDDITRFRNKISAKAHINPALMCDNQLDESGNFVWGERGRHAKRFFTNFFRTIDPTDGYKEYETRIFPNGSRKLAIGNLIISTNTEVIRKQMDGESVQYSPVTSACVSKANGTYVYPCCCVTLENGRPLLSKVKMPTKNHLAIGNSGDTKYVDLPRDTDMKMYIAKDGYCYVNIFLAALVNVKQSDAKTFTKMIRDDVIERLGMWPSLRDLATWCYFISVFYPDVSNAELPRILVDHNTQTMHVIDSYGSLTTGYHVLKANTFSQLIEFAYNGLESEMKSYKVGGIPDISRIDAELNSRGGITHKTTRSLMHLLIRGVYRPKLFVEILLDEPYIIVLGTLSPSVLLAMYNSGSLETALNLTLGRNENLFTVIKMMSELAERVSVASTIEAQFTLIESHASTFRDIMTAPVYPSYTHKLARDALEVLGERRHTDRELISVGFGTLKNTYMQEMEKIYIQELKESWGDLSLCQKWRSIKQSRKQRRFTTKYVVDKKKELDTSGLRKSLAGAYLVAVTSTLSRRYSQGRKIVAEKASRFRSYCISSGLNIILGNLPVISNLLNMVALISGIIAIWNVLMHMVCDYRTYKQKALTEKFNNEYDYISLIHSTMNAKRDCETSVDEVESYIDEKHPELKETFRYYKSDWCGIVPIQLQAAPRKSEADLERVIAFTALVMMMFDAERSDGVYRILNKLKGLTRTIDEPISLQSLDDIKSELTDHKHVINFEIKSDDTSPNAITDKTFSQWWDNQINRGNTVPHYRTTGHFMEFTRANAAEVAHQIAHGEHNDILLRGAVGSGKSTGLPYHLHKKGSVLVLEPTKPLATNVWKQLSGAPFHVAATVRMRGMSQFGSSAITIMTSGFALHYYAHEIAKLKEYEFIIIDECHVHDSNAMAFRCLLHEINFQGKVIKVSATPPGREVEFSTQHPVEIVIEEGLTQQQFVQSLGTGSTSDATKYGDNILVYVASYNEVDQLSKALIDKKYKVTKVDGRTMKMGSSEIPTEGTKQRKHFVVATNIIENGVTLDIEVVVDFGTKVVPELDTDDRLVRYRKKAISLGERIQRLGRVGRNKPGTAIRIGHTEKGISEIPPIVATEAALYCFSYGLPVMTNNVSCSLIKKCTKRQVDTMHKFELSPFYMYNLVKSDGTMHPAIHEILKGFKLRDSEITLTPFALPNTRTANWRSVAEYRKVGERIELEEEVKIPFSIKDIPEGVHKNIWKATIDFKGDAGFGTVRTANVVKIAYTLRTDPGAVQRTLRILDTLIAEERCKQAYFESITHSSMCMQNISLTTLAQAIKSRYARDYSTENLSILQHARDRINEWQYTEVDVYEGDQDEFIKYEEFYRSIRAEGALENVILQSKEDISRHLGLKGKWNKSLITRDLLLFGGVLVGGVWMLYTGFMEKWNEPIALQAKNKSKRAKQKLGFRHARDKKVGHEIFGDDNIISENFGTAYARKGKGKGTYKGQGIKARKFINMYGYDPADFSFVRFVDPLTGFTIDESPYTDIDLINEQFWAERERLIEEGGLTASSVDKGIQAYFIKNLTSKALKVDMTKHNPLALGKTTNNIAGFPERRGELRQTGVPIIIDPENIPKERKIPDSTEEEVTLEAKSLVRGLRDYNPIAACVCKLINDSSGGRREVCGIGFGSMIITNQHLFEHNNGQLEVYSHHGEFIVKNTCTLKIFPIHGRDMMIIQMPKDFPPFPKRLQFRTPIVGEKVCLVSTLFQEKYNSSVVSETCTTVPATAPNTWVHVIDTKNGHCGLPLVSTTDGKVLGIHFAASEISDRNFFVSFDNDFHSKYLDKPENNEWVQHWKFNPENVMWGRTTVKNFTPEKPFKISKLISDLFEDQINLQGMDKCWFRNQLHGNVKAVATCPSQLVTKHIVKGKCALFDLYLQTHTDEEAYFRPLMGAYQKSRLNREAFTKDIMKYATPIEVGMVDSTVFEETINNMMVLFDKLGFTTCEYITDEQTILSSLNMKSATGALYGGKKKDYFKDYTLEQFGEVVQASCERLYNGKLGIWTGSLKAELRPIEKVEANKTRVFTAAPLDTLLAGKVCVDDFNNKFYALNIKAPWTVGMSKFFGGWNELLTNLPDGWVYCDADGSQFDSSLSPYLINAVLDLRLRMMERWDIGDQMLKNLYTEIVYTPILTPDSTIVKKFKGNNSGQPSTVVDNTLMVIIAMKYTLSMLGIPDGKQDAICRYYVNGDDLLIAIAPTHQHLLDDFKQSFATLGLKYDFTSRTHNKEDLWFMSHKGLHNGDMYIPKLEEERIVSILEWDRSTQPEHRMEAICAAMIESWGYPRLTHEIRKFYQWVLDQAPYNILAKEGRAPYIAESALRKLYTGTGMDGKELQELLTALRATEIEDEWPEEEIIVLQAKDELIDAGSQQPQVKKEKGSSNPVIDSKQREAEEGTSVTSQNRDRDVNVGTQGTFAVQRVKQINSKLRTPKSKGKVVVNLDHLLQYKPDQRDISNTRATQAQFEAWYEGVKKEYDSTDQQMDVILNGLMVWCIENGTSSDLSGNWTMMDGDEQVEFPIKPLIDYARPTFRQIMAHFSDLAEAYIVMRNMTEQYMPRYGLQRNLRDKSMARYAFDFYEMTAKAPTKAIEARHQMKAAAIGNANNKMFGLDGGSAATEEDTERHTANDVNRNTHNLNGMLGMR